MHLICSRYVFVHLLHVTIMISFCFISILWLEQILRYSYLYKTAINFTLFMQLAINIMPTIILPILPIIVSTSGIVGYYTLQTSGQLRAFFTLGVNRQILAIPYLSIACIVSLVAIIFSLYLKPISITLLKNNLVQINRSINQDFFEEGKVNKITDSLKIYVDNKNKEKLNNIFVIDTTKPRDIIFADWAKLHVSDEGYLVMQLYNAEKHFISDEERVASINFKTLDIKIKKLFNIDSNNNFEILDTKYLWKMANHVRIASELASRVIWPFYNILMALVVSAVLLFNCNISKKNIILTLICLGFVLINYFLCLQLAANNVDYIKYRFLNSFFFLCIFSYILSKR